MKAIFGRLRRLKNAAAPGSREQADVEATLEAQALVRVLTPLE